MNSKIQIKSMERIFTENPINEVWSQLRLFESEYYCKQILQEKFNDIDENILKKCSLKMSTNAKQAFEYYHAASKVSILTSPLLYFYGITCLSNLLLAVNLKLEDLKTHGLSSKSDENNTLSDEYVLIFKKGAFPALHSCFSDELIKTNSKFYFEEILSLIPDLKDFYEKIYNKKAWVIRLKNDDYFIYKDVENSVYQAFLKKSENYFAENNIIFSNGISNDIICYGNTQYDESRMLNYPIQKNIQGELFFTLPLEFNNKIYGIPEASAHFITMFILGMLARYQPEKWMTILEGKETSDVNIINKFIEISKRKFPNLILNAIYQYLRHICCGNNIVFVI